MSKGRIEKGDIVAEGVLRDFNKEIEVTIANINTLKTAVLAVAETGKKLKKGVSTVKPKDVKTVQQFNALTEKSNQNAKNRLQIDKQLLTEKEKLKQQQTAQNKAIKTEVALGDKQINTLEKLRARNAAIKIAKDKVNYTTKKGQEAIKKLNAELNKNNKILDKNASKLGKLKNNIGNYGSALRGLGSALGITAGITGLVTALKGAFNIVKDFEQGQADLASVLGVSVDQMSALTKQAKELGATTTFTASQVSELQKEYAKLGFSMSEIEDVTEATLSLAEATGTDLARAAEVTGATIRGFGLSATDTQRVVDVMAKSFSSSSLDMEKFATAMSSVAPVAKNAGFSIEETTALLGTLTDRGIDASSAGTGLRNMFLDSKKAGLTFNEALEEVNGASDKTAKSFELFGKRGATLGVILAENQGAVGTLTDKLLDSDNAAKEMADTQRKTLGGSIKLLTSAYEGWILKMNEAGGVGEKLRNGIAFLADNFDTLISWIGKAVVLIVQFKVAMKALEISKSIGGLKGLGKAFKSIGGAAKGATKGAKNLGKAMKGIGFGLAITALLELAKGFYDAASGAKLYREELDKFQKYQKGFDKALNNKIKLINEELKGKLDLIDANKKLTKSEKSKDKQKEIKKTTDAITAQVVELRRRDDALMMGLENYNKQDKAQGGLTIKQEASRKEQKRLIQANRNQITTLKGYRTELTGQKASLIELAKAKSEYIEVTDDEAKEISLLRQIKDEEIEKEEDEDERQRKRLKEDAKRRIEDLKDVVANETEKARLVSLINENLAKDLAAVGKKDEEKVDEVSQEQINVQQAEYNILIADANISEEEMNNLLTRQILAKAELEKLGKTELERKIIDQKALKEINALTKKEIDNTAELAKMREDALEFSQDIAIALIDKRIEALDRETEAHIKQAETFRTLAENGSIEAKESLAEENRLAAESEQKAAELEKRKQRILMVTNILKAFNANLSVEGTTSGEALAKAITSEAVLNQFIASIGSAYEGMEDTGTAKNPLDSNGGRVMLLHDNERIMTAKQNAMIGGVSNDHVAQVMEQHRLGNYMDGGQLVAKVDNAELVNGLNTLTGKIEAVEKAILNQPKESNNTAEMLSNYMVFENHQIQGGKTTTSRFKVKR